MNNTIKLAVASALLAAASSANAGIMIPAGDWTLDIGGVVNAYYTSTRVSGSAANSTGTKTASNITTGLLPNYLSVSGKTRQNDLDVGFTISINPGASTVGSGNQLSQQENRQAFLTFGDASWGSIKLGKDLGIYASDAILNDMTLLGVGWGAGALAGNTTTLGGIGVGYMYADWKSQIAYSSPNWNGFSFTAGVTQSWGPDTAGGLNSNHDNIGAGRRGGSEPAFEAKASYAWAGDFAGKVWVSGITQNVELGAFGDDRANAWDIGANVNVAGFGLTGYYGQGEGTGTTVLFAGGYDAAGKAQDSDDWYLQATYTLPGVGTKLGARYGESTLDLNSGGEVSNEMWAIGAYHPLTKHLNLVAEYADQKAKATGAEDGKAKTVSLGAILFF
ncbi:MAG: porin [Methylotenera sp.]|nr:porin [Methylotenera sp.]